MTPNEWNWVHVFIGGLSSLIFLFQALGSAHSDTDSTIEGAHDSAEESASGESHLSDFLSVRNFVAFFMGYGWVTLASSISGNSRLMSSAFGAAAGVVFVLASFFLLKTFLRLQEDGSLKLESLTGHQASVYISVAARSSAIGKVLVDTKTGRVELPARTRDEESIPPGVMVKIMGCEGGVLWVTAKKD